MVKNGLIYLAAVLVFILCFLTACATPCGC